MASVNLLELATMDAPKADQNELRLIKLNGDEIAVVPFTIEAEQVTLHYCKEPEIQSYIHCNGDGCVLCKIGRSKTEKLLYPVYLPTAQEIGILPVSPSQKPKALLPQLGVVLQDAEKELKLLFICKIDSFSFSVKTGRFPEGSHKGVAVIDHFNTGPGRDTNNFASVYQRISNEQLATIPGIKNALALRGLL